MIPCGECHFPADTLIRAGFVPEARPDICTNWLQRVCRTFEKSMANLNQQLAAAKGEAVDIETWLASPVTKPLQLRGERRQRLLVLKKQVIPALEQEMSLAQTRANDLQRLVQLAEQIHEKACIHLAVLLEVEDVAS